MPTERDSFADFKAVAERYFEVIESARGESRDELLADLAAALSALYNRALLLPDVWDDAWTFPGERDTTDEGYFERRQQPIFRQLKPQLDQALQKIDYYWTVVAFGEEDKGELYGHMLSDDLADIYWDLHDGFDILGAGGSEGEATYTWRWGFWHHWGEHAVNALRIIHARLPPASTSIGSEE